MDAKQQRARTMEVLIEQVRNMAARAPVLILFEDVHWSDPTSLELLGRFIETLTNLRVLLVLTARPEFQSPWAASDQVTNLALNRLTRAQSAAIVQALITDCDLPPPVVERMLDTTDGVPLFVEEMTKAVLESAAQSRPDPKRAASSAYDSLSVPATLRDSLMARLDRLGTAREVAEIGAALGREFSYELCWAVTAFDELKLRAALAEIVASELLLQRGQPRQASYTFKHALVQEVAYGTMLQDKRRKLHLTIAHVLKEQFPSVIEARPEVLARHYAEAGAVDSAVKYFGQAGRLAAARSANLEAIAHLERALELLRALPENAGRHERELALLTMLAGALIASTGYTTPQLNAVLTRAMELAAEGGDPVPLFPILHGRYLFLSVSGQTRKAFELAERLFRLAQAHAPRTAQMTSHRVLGNSLFLMGELARARGHLESALAMYVPEEHAPLAIQLGQDARVAALSVLALTRWQLGEAAGALELEQTAVELAERLKHANSLSYALAHGALLHGVAGNHSNQKLRAEALFEVASVADLPVWKAASLFLRGWAVAGLGDLKPGLMLMQEGDAILSKIGVRYWRPVILTELGRFLARFGDTAAALAKLEEAEAIAREGGEIWFNGECFRVAAELGLMAGRTDVQETERAFDRALVAARSTGSKSFELRTAVSLAHFWHTQDRHRDAHDLLAQVCSTVGEGANIPDLQQARMLMEERARQC
jgi:predicted ATPase